MSSKQTGEIVHVVNALLAFVVELLRVRNVNGRNGRIAYQSIGSIIEETCQRSHLEISRHIVRLKCSVSTII